MTRLESPIVVEPLPIEEGGGFLATAPDLPGCMSDGATPEEAVSNIQDAITAWVVVAAHDLGHAVPKPSPRVHQWCESSRLANDCAIAQSLREWRFARVGKSVVDRAIGGDAGMAGSHRRAAIGPLRKLVLHRSKAAAGASRPRWDAGGRGRRFV